MLDKIIIIASFVVIALGVLISLKFIKNKLLKLNASGILNSVVKYCFVPFDAIILLILARVFITFLKLPEQYLSAINQGLSFLLVILVTWLITGCIQVFSNFLSQRFTIEVKDNLKSRKIYTQINIFKRVLITVVIILGIGMALMAFDAGKQIGRTILVSASIISVIVGVAAQKTLSSLLAGIQLAITQPVRIDDVVIVEGEWGRVEEITLTYIVIRIWDLRRLVVPVTYFIDHPFQNWTRKTTEILGTVFLYVDYAMSIEKIRAELNRILQQSVDWDGNVAGVQVTNATDRTLEVRVLVSAADSSKLWNLRCAVREQLVDFIRKNHPEALPRIRTDFKDVAKK